MTALALIFTLSIIGISETVYIIRKRIFYEKPMCPVGGNCMTVLSSKYNRIFLIPNDILGLITYVVISFLAVSLLIGEGQINLIVSLLKIIISIASLFSLVLTYLQWRVIRAWCFWCVLSAITIWLMEIILLTNNLT